MRRGIADYDDRALQAADVVEARSRRRQLVAAVVVVVFVVVFAIVAQELHLQLQPQSEPGRHSSHPSSSLSLNEGGNRIVGDQ
jgi:hypothetical protein